MTWSNYAVILKTEKLRGVIVFDIEDNKIYFAQKKITL